MRAELVPAISSPLVTPAAALSPTVPAAGAAGAMGPVPMLDASALPPLAKQALPVWERGECSR
jgi:hypothetical protein